MTLKKYLTLVTVLIISITNSYCQQIDTLVQQEVIDDVPPDINKVGIAPSEKTEQEIFAFVEQMPQFPGGESAMYKFLGDNIHYPESARKANVQGKVFVQFVVSPNGELTDLKILRGVSTDIDNEALRVIHMMPNWVPGKQNGRCVSVLFTLPINFKLK